MVCYELRLVYLWFVWFDGDKNGMMIEYVYGTSTTYNQWEHQEPNMEVAEAYFSPDILAFRKWLPSGNQPWLAGESPISIYKWRFAGTIVELNGELSMSYYMFDDRRVTGYDS
jgi:hypothetical protein